MTKQEALTLNVGDEVIFLETDQFGHFKSKRGEKRTVFEEQTGESSVIKLNLLDGEIPDDGESFFAAYVSRIALHRRRGSIEKVINSTNIIKKTIMDIRQAFKNLFISEEQKMFRKLGIVSDDGSLTSDGREIYIQHLFNNDKAFVEVAKRMLAEKKDNTD